MRLEEFSGALQGRLAVVYSSGSSWLPTEFMAAQYITRILVVGRQSVASLSLAADPGWTQVWRSPGGREWSCLLGILQHMPGPLLVVVGPDVAVSPQVVRGLRGPTNTILLLRPPVMEPALEADQYFFPVIRESQALSALSHLLQEWNGSVGSSPLDLKSVLPQLAASGYALTVGGGGGGDRTWCWYRPAESPPLVSLTVAQMGRQIQLMGAVLEGLGTLGSGS